MAGELHAQAIHDDVDNRDHEKSEDGRDGEAAHHHDAPGIARLGAGTAAEDGSPNVQHQFFPAQT